MPSVVNDLFKVTFKGTYFSQAWFNTFYYYNVSGVGNLNLVNVADDWDAVCVDAYDDACNDATTFDEIRVAHTNGTLADYTRIPSQIVGSVVGGNVPPFIAYGIRLNRTTKETRNGWKRIIGAVEENMGATSWAGSYNALMGTLADTFLEKLNMGGAVDNLEPVIIRQTAPSSWTYNLIASHTTINKPTTQNSRKIGVGI